jgi:IS30 family transposase
MSSYTQLTAEERYHIYTMTKKGLSLREIAKGMGRSHSSLSRELRRNKGGSGYRYQQAHQLAVQRHKEKPKSTKLTVLVTDYINKKLALLWSPDQICGRLLLDQNTSLSHETVYRYILNDQQQDGTLYRHLRHQLKTRRKRYGSYDYRGKIPGRVDISERPGVVDERSRVGDWEADLVIGKGHKGAIVTLAERRTRLYLAMPIANKTKELTTGALTALLGAVKDFVHTITYDNGREFNGHLAVSKELECEGYFARPYHSWERGLNENSNGLLRQYFPKSMPLDEVTESEVLTATNAMNDRPRKCLGYKTPWEAFIELTQAHVTKNTSGALMT